MDWRESDIPFWMDDVQCQSASTNFLSCSRTDYYYDYYDDSYYGSPYEDCSHSENILLTCFQSGKFESYSFSITMTVQRILCW